MNKGPEWELYSVLQYALENRPTDPDEEEVAGLMWVLYWRLYENPK